MINVQTSSILKKLIITVSVADAVSNEASKYGRGLLTRALGARIRENQFADINLLFDYVQEIVPNIEKKIGGIQQPRIIMTDTSVSTEQGE